MLKTRVATAVVLLVSFLSAIFYLPNVGWVVFVTVVAALGAWEWGGLLALRSIARLAVSGGFVFVCLVFGYFQPSALGLRADFARDGWEFGRWFYLPSAIFWIVIVPVWMRQRWQLPRSALGLFIGAVVLFPAWLALIQLRQVGDLALLAIMATVWLADIAAYFSGRQFGRHKLAPNISPGKTWEGAIGAALAVVVYGFALSRYFPVALSSHRLLLAAILLLVTAISIVGDLFESLLKRQAGLKDSSRILPGHGGVLDRIDSLTPTLPLVALVWLANLN